MRVDGETDMTTVIAAFRNCVNALKTPLRDLDYEHLIKKIVISAYEVQVNHIITDTVGPSVKPLQV
jgi:hypothetical protein